MTSNNDVPTEFISDTAKTAIADEATLVSDPESAVVDKELERRVMWKIDSWLVVFYSAVYIFRVIDSGNYANAAIINLENGTGIKKQLGFTPSQWAWTQSIFSYSYMIFEPTNTILLKIFTPSRWMFILIIFWGISASSSAAAQDFPGMMCVRFAGMYKDNSVWNYEPLFLDARTLIESYLIGLAEAGFFPSVLYHYAFWYKPNELPQRVAIFYSVGQLSSALSGLLAYAISFMDGLGGLPGWRWLFLLEGLPAILLAFVALWGVPDYPETAKMLTEEERRFLKGRLSTSAPRGDAKHWDFESVKKLLRDPTFYTFTVYWICHGIGGFGVGYALPTVIYELGFTTTANSQLMNIPPYVGAFLFLNTVGFLLHKKIIRPWTTAAAIESTIIICYIILVTVRNPVVKYICLIVAIACAGSAYPVIWPERMRALKGTVASGIGIGFTNAMAQFSGIVGPHVYSTVFGPTYRTSYMICLSVLVVGISANFASWSLIHRRDQRKASQVS